jgi:hypothetical protein
MHRVPWSAFVQRRAAIHVPTAALHGGGIEGSTATPKTCQWLAWSSPLLSLSAIDSVRVSSQEEAGWHAQLRSQARALAIVYAGETRGLQGVGAGLGVVPGEACADDAHGVWAGLSGLQQPQVNGCDVQGYLERSKQLTAGSIEGSE